MPSFRAWALRTTPPPPLSLLLHPHEWWRPTHRLHRPRSRSFLDLTTPPSLFAGTSHRLSHSTLLATAPALTVDWFWGCVFFFKNDRGGGEGRSQRTEHLREIRHDFLHYLSGPILSWQYARGISSTLIESSVAPAHDPSSLGQRIHVSHAPAIRHQSGAQSGEGQGCKPQTRTLHHLGRASHVPSTQCNVIRARAQHCSDELS